MNLKKANPLFVALILSCGALWAAQQPPWTGKCVGVIDGDTISVMHDGAEVRVRLHGVDCPEKSQAFGQRAKEFSSNQVFGKVVTVHPTATDRYGRTVGHVVLENGMDLSGLLLEAGFAWYYQKYAPELESKLKPLEQHARQSRMGLWADPNPVPPWEFRKPAKGMGDAAARPAVSASQADQGGSVVITPTGKKFHRPACPTLSRSKHLSQVSRTEAIGQGRGPCAVCAP